MNRLRITTFATLAFALALGGCKNQQPTEPELAQVPPPAYESEEYEPITVEPAEVQTVAPAPGPAGQPQARAVQPQPLPAPAPATVQQTYTIRKGDTLWSIAQRHYGNGQRWVDIVQANPGLEPTKLRVGQTVTLPE